MNFLILFNLIAMGCASAVVSHHWEQRQGDCVRGGYSFLDADGRVRVVDYRVNGNKGFQAVVTFRPPGGSERHNQQQARYPFWLLHPIVLQTPVGTITQDLLQEKRSYPNTNLY